MTNCRYLLICVITLATSLVGGCGTPGLEKGVQNESGKKVRYISPEETGDLAGRGFEGNDIDTMADQMVRSILSKPLFANASRPPRIEYDYSEFRNKSSERLEKAELVDQVIQKLQMNSIGRLEFVDTEALAAIEKRRALKRAGKTDTGTTGRTKATAGGDYLLGGTIYSVGRAGKSSGIKGRRFRIQFKLTDLESGLMVWADQFQVNKEGGEDVIYR